MAAGIYAKELGTLIKARTPYENLNPKFRKQLEKFGIRGVKKGGEAEWRMLLRMQPLDERGRIDPYAIAENTFEACEELKPSLTLRIIIVDRKIDFIM